MNSPSGHIRRISARHPKWDLFARTIIALMIGAVAAEMIFRGFLIIQNKPIRPAVYEIFLVGESTAEGQPYEYRLDFAKIAAHFLGGSINNAEIVIHRLARKANRLDHQRPKLQMRIAHRDARIPGAVFIYGGHNDPVMYYKEASADVRRFRLIDDFLQRHSLLYAQFDMLAKTRRVLPKRYSPPARQDRSSDYWTYENNLRHAIELSLENGLVPILSTVAGNLSDFDPGLPQTDADPAALSSIREGMTMEKRGDFRSALAHYKRLITMAGIGKNFVRYRIGRCLKAMGRNSEARRHFLAVVEVDGDLHRTVAMQNALIRSLAAEYQVPLVDAEKAFEDASPGSITGRELFVDIYHPNLDGYILLGRLFAEKLAERQGIRLVRTAASKEEIIRQFGMDNAAMARSYLRVTAWYLHSLLGHALPDERAFQAETFLREALRYSDTPELRSLAVKLKEFRLRPDESFRQEILRELVKKMREPTES